MRQLKQDEGAPCEELINSHREENGDLNQKVRHLQVITEDHQPLLKETPAELRAERENERASLTNSLTQSKEDRERHLKRSDKNRRRSGLQRRLAEKRAPMEEAEEELSKKNSRTDKLKSIAENYTARIQADEEKIKAFLLERIAASASERTAPSIAKERAPHEVGERTRKRRGFAWRNVLISVMSFALTLPFLLSPVVSTVPACREASGVQCSELLQEAVRSVIEPYCPLPFTEPPPI
ncbi:hypothetical protein AOLI_G00226140 [Acnodon oligacanthus]